MRPLSPGIAAGRNIPPSLAIHRHVDKRQCRFVPQAAGGEAADDRRPPRGLLQHLAARSRPLACLGSIQYPRYHTYRIDPPARDHSGLDCHVRELKLRMPALCDLL